MTFRKNWYKYLGKTYAKNRPLIGVVWLIFISYFVFNLHPHQQVKSNPEPLLVVSPSPSPIVLSDEEQMIGYLVETFGADTDLAITLLLECENKRFDPKAVHYNTNGTVDRGLFQINSVHGGEELLDWKTNIDKAYQIYHASGDKFTAWSCAWVINQ